MIITDEMVNNFLTWKLPTSVCSDLCVTMVDYPHQRSGTNLLSFPEAKLMLEHIAPLLRKAALEEAAKVADRAIGNREPWRINEMIRDLIEKDQNDDDS